ncbi:hypothetical protein FGL98_23085 [Leekyejoonella antrihumi]|uniref:ClpX-type ZB domain-containing protein n=1 Tax=Leekyejoonella antrihumi TaxID=1660198 RepID=A0A563DS99_9MICO|nr:hypothetical protein FGL98_23085 [Leekyejoonella antrihumi]
MPRHVHSVPRGGTSLRCSFCGKDKSTVDKLIAGPNGVFICDECVRLCDEILDEEQAHTE